MNNAFKPADILVPKSGTDMKLWSVVACDQYTSEPEYWNEVYSAVGTNPSTLNLILPEIYLEDNDVDKRIEKIHGEMKKYLANGIFDEYKDSVIYIERVQSNGIVRAGIIGKIDLEEYDISKGSTSQVRATEATVIERIPPRIKVRNGAELELPHIMVLIDDEDKAVIEPLSANKNKFRKIYDFSLMQGGGSVSGFVVDKESQKNILSSLEKLGDAECFNKKYSLNDTPVLLYAMGDGNHSLATAKQYYQNLKAANPDRDMSSHPARYALVEIVNLHSNALCFEAIHRIVKNVDVDKLITEMNEKLEITSQPQQQSFRYYIGGVEKTAYIGKPSSNLTVGSLQTFLDSYLKENGGDIDYIHGEDTVKAIADKCNGIGFILPDMNKNQLFPTVIKDGALPRKTFSMGHAADKRFYIEARKITE